MAPINSWVTYKHVCNSSKSRRMFIQRVSEELTGGTPNKKLQTESNSAVAECAPTPKKRKTYSDNDCKNRTTYICAICKKTVSGKCQTNQCKTCTSRKSVFPASLLVFYSCLFLFCLVLQQYSTVSDFSSQLKS